MPNAKEVMDITRSVYLNDASGGTYTDTVMLPGLRVCYDQFQNALQENNIPTVEAKEVKTIVANVDEYYPLPPDFFLPTFLEERTPGTTAEYSPMFLYRSLPTVTKGSTLLYWEFLADRIKFVGANTNREVRLHYQSVFPAVDVVSVALFGKSEQFLAAKLAAFVHMFITQEKTLAEAANQVAEAELSQIINIQTKKMQAISVRPLPYLPQRRR